MESKNLKSLQEIVSVLLENDDDFLRLTENIKNLKSLFLKGSQLLEDDEQNRTNVLLESGEAIGPTWAAMCVDDLLRTKRFICGIDAAIQQKQTDANQKPIKILYVGPGPFGTLAMPLIAKYTAEEIQFVFLEVNPNTVNYLKKTIAFFNAEKYVTEIKICDATTIQLNEHKNADVLIVECLQRALEKEPQVAIVYNVLPQLHKDVIMIPEEIKLSIGLSNTEIRQQQITNIDSSHEDFTTTFAPFLSLNKQSVLSDAENQNLTFKEHAHTFIPQQLLENDSISIFTNITLYKDFKLTHLQSGLTVPQMIASLSDKNITGIKAVYKTGKSPHVETTLIRK